MSKKNLVREKQKYETFHIRIPVDLARLIRDLSDKSQLSLNATIAHAILKGIEKEKAESGRLG